MSARDVVPSLLSPPGLSTDCRCYCSSSPPASAPSSPSAPPASSPATNRLPPRSPTHKHVLTIDAPRELPLRPTHSRPHSPLRGSATRRPHRLCARRFLADAAPPQAPASVIPSVDPPHASGFLSFHQSSQVTAPTVPFLGVVVSVCPRLCLSFDRMEGKLMDEEGRRLVNTRYHGYNSFEELIDSFRYTRNTRSSSSSSQSQPPPPLPGPSSRKITIKKTKKRRYAVPLFENMKEEEEDSTPTITRQCQQPVCLSSEEACQKIASFAYTGHLRRPFPSSATTTTTITHLSNNNDNIDNSRLNTRMRVTTVLKMNKRKTTLTAKERFKDAYKRVPEDDRLCWIPPPSPYKLLQESYYDDPWKVLIICILCNRTRGAQADQILPLLFNECSSPECTLEVPVEKIEEIIKGLGLQRKRAETIKKLAKHYLSDWTYVSLLPGIGKYAADAYAIFCSGYWKEVEPVDKKLELYWNFLHEWEREKQENRV